MIRTAITVGAAGLATAASIITISVRQQDKDARQQDVNIAVCTAVVKIDGAITGTLKRSLKNVPKLKYYKEHPDELAAQERDIQRTLNDFRPPPECHLTGGTNVQHRHKR